MIDPNGMQLGDAVCVVNEKNNWFRREKIKFVDENGIEWYRYDRDHYEWSISELVYCGKVTVIEEGEVDKDHDRQDQMHFKYPDGVICYEYTRSIHENENWFHTREEAATYIEQQKLLKLK